MSIDTLDKCRLASEKRWNDLDVKIQKIQDDLTTLQTKDIPVLETRLNKQAAMVSDIQQLTLNVSSLSQTMQSMLEEMRTQSTRISNLEQKPIKRWDSVLETIIKVGVTALIGVILVKLGLQ